jgi:hypothetical protein
VFLTRDRCNDYKHIFAEITGRKNGNFVSKFVSKSYRIHWSSNIAIFSAENWSKSPKTVQNHRKLAKIAENCDPNIDQKSGGRKKLVKIAEHWSNSPKIAQNHRKLAQIA